MAPKSRFPKFEVPKCSQEEVPQDSQLPSQVLKQGSQRFRARESQRIPNKQGFQEQVPKGFQTRIRFPKILKGTQEQLPKQGSQEQVPKQGFQARVPKQGSQEKVFKQGCQEQVPRTGFQASLPRTGSQARSPSKLSKNRFPRQVPKQGSRE